MSTVTNRDKRLYNADLAPTPSGQKNWGAQAMIMLSLSPRIKLETSMSLDTL